MIKRLIVLLFFTPVILTAELPVGWEKVTIIPRLEALEDNSLTAFLDSLNQAIENSDSLFVYKHLSPEVTSTYGDESTIGSFKRFWRPYQPYGKFWTEIQHILDMGGDFHIGRSGVPEYSAPYILGIRRKSPSIPSNINDIYFQEVGALATDTFVVYLDQGGDDDKREERLDELAGSLNLKIDSLVRVSLRDGRKGYCECRSIIGPANTYRAGFVKRENKWYMTHFVGGF
ncbi:MAG: hypothetical protein V1794_04760 [Candidatus Glassbacteria bacterium]